MIGDGHRVRIGCDLVSVTEVADSLERWGDRYLRRVFTESEASDCAGPDRALRLAARFAAKEATIKAIGEPDAHFPMLEIEVAKSGPLPSLHLHGSVALRASQQGWTETELSLSHTDCHAMAVLVVLCNPPDSTPAEF